MYKKIIFTTLLFTSLSAFAQQSSITEAEGYSCMGVDKSKKQTENAALTDAKRNAVEFSKTFIQSESQIENFELKKDLIEAFSQAAVKVLDVVDRQWQAPAEGDCYTVRIKAEIIPSDEVMKKSTAVATMQDDPSAPLTVKIWTNKTDFTAGDTMKVFIKANKGFFGRLVYQDASNTHIQLLPNPYRSDQYFKGGVIYEIPEGNDKFDLTISKPFGKEKLTLYASTAELGNVESQNVGPVYIVPDAEETASRTRGISFVAVTEESQQKRKEMAEFDEASIDITTSAN